MSFILRFICLSIFLYPITGYGKDSSKYKEEILAKDVLDQLQSSNLKGFIKKYKNKKVMIKTSDGGRRNLMEFFDPRNYKKGSEKYVSVKDLQDFVRSGVNLSAKVGDGMYLATTLSLYGSPEHFEYLRKKGMPLDAPFKQGATPFNLAISMGNAPLVKYIVPYTDMDFYRPIGDIKLGGMKLYPLSELIRDYPDLVPMAVEAGADVNKGYGFIIPIIVAAQDSPEVIPFLIKKGVDVNAKWPNGFTALHAAAQKNPKAIPWLLKAGADVNARWGERQVSVFLSAAMKSCHAISEVLKGNPDGINYAWAHSGFTPLMFLMNRIEEKPNDPYCKGLTQKMLDMGADPHMKAHKKKGYNTALSIAKKLNLPKQVKIMENHINKKR